MLVMQNMYAAFFHALQVGFMPMSPAGREHASWIRANTAVGGAGLGNSMSWEPLGHRPSLLWHTYVKHAFNILAEENLPLQTPAAHHGMHHSQIYPCSHSGMMAMLTHAGGQRAG